MVSVNFYNYNGDIRVINKKLPTPVDINCELRESFNVLNPTLLVRRTSRPDFNYCKIDSLGRFYSITDIKFVGNFTYEISLKVDVLKTYENEIFAATATAGESDNPNKHISTRTTVYDRTPNYEKINFPQKGLFNKEGSIIMITIKGNK
jgi:hypothetical protein